MVARILALLLLALALSPAYVAAQTPEPPTPTAAPTATPTAIPSVNLDYSHVISDATGIATTVVDLGWEGPEQALLLAFGGLILGSFVLMLAGALVRPRE